MRRTSSTVTYLIAFFIAALPTTSIACPLIEGIVDFNCDGKIRIAFTGDSLVKGIGDPKGLGYPGRLARRIANIEVENIGVAGTTPRRLRRSFIKNLPKGKVTTRKSRDLDYLVIQVGTNAYWNFQPESFVIRDIRRLKKTLEEKLEEMFTVAPLIFVSTLPPTRRDFQQPFIDKVNSLLIDKVNRSRLRVRVRLDQLSVTHVSDDNLHLNGRGYKKATDILEGKLFGTFPRMALKKRSDFDNDLLYDELEPIKFFTDPMVNDTDSDTLLDGVEVFEFETNPLNPDTDGDEVSDNIEIESGLDPLIPNE